MENLKVTFDILEHRTKIPVGYDKVSGHLVFDISMALEHKSRWVKDRYKPPEPNWSSFSGVGSRESTIVSLTCAVPNNLPVYVCDVHNAYL